MLCQTEECKPCAQRYNIVKFHQPEALIADSGMRPGPVFTKILILRIFLRIVIFLRKNLRIRIFLFTNILILRIIVVLRIILRMVFILRIFLRIRICYSQNSYS